MFKKTITFLKEVRLEMGKVNWPTKDELFASTWVVLLFSVIVALGVWVFDLFFSRVLRIILG